MPLSNTFTPVSGSPDPQSTGLNGTQGLSVSGKFYDYKQDVQFDVEATLPQTQNVYSTAITEYEVAIDKLSQNSPSDAKYYYFTPESTPDCITSDSITKKNIHGSFVKSSVANITSSDKGFNFQNGVTYAIKHRVTIQKTHATNSSMSVKYVLGHVQTFTYYDTPLTFTDFSFIPNVQLGDTLSVSGLLLNPSDGTQPLKVKFKFNRYDSNNNDGDIYFTSEHDYQPSGLYSFNLPSVQNAQGFVLGNAYVITAHGNWELGYSTSKSSSQLLYLLNRPEILQVNVLPLSVNNDSNILKITTSQILSSGGVAASSKIWFEFYEPSNNLVARAGDDPAENNTGITTTSDNIYYLKLSDIDIISGGGLLVDVVYSVVAKIRYGVSSPPEFRSSDPFQNVTFNKTRPSISNSVINTLYVANANEKILTIDVDNAAYYLYAPKVSQGIRFHFYDESVSITTIHASTLYRDFVNNTSVGAVSYDIKLSDILTSSPSSSPSSSPLINGVNYRVKAEVSLIEHDGGSETRLSVLSDPLSDRVNFRTEYPVIDRIDGYDVQNDGDDGDSADQIVATVYVNKGQYELVAPNSVNGIRFLIYNNANAQTLIAKTKSYDFVNISTVSKHGYNVELSEITLESGQNALVNGKEYYVKAEVTIVKHSGSNELRLSNTKPVTFSQDIVPISSVHISNTWALATNNNPSSSESRFKASPLVGVSGYFNKTAQFGSGYEKDLDETTTQYLLEYSIDAGDSWTPVQKAVLIQQAASGQTFEDAVAGATSGTVATKPNGRYPNVAGPTNVLGTNQNPIVFFIPQDQGSGNAFTEADTVQVRVTVIDTAGLWAPGNNTSSATDSNSLQVIKRINSYDFSNGTDSEPWNSQNKAHYDNNTTTLHVDVNGTIVTSSLSNVLADSNQITSFVNGGLKIVNTGVGTAGAASGKLPKVNLYTYGNTVPAASQTTSNSVTVSQINGLGAYYIIDQQPTAVEYPFIVIYTTPTSSGTNRGGWYKSKLYYAPSSSGNTVDSSKVGLTLLYTGNDDSSFRSDIPSHRRVKCELLPMVPNDPSSLTLSNDDYANEFVNSVSIQTSSNASASSAGNFNFVLSEGGLKTSSLVLPYIVMRFTLKLALNIPVAWNSIHAHSVKVGYKYSSGGSYTYQTFNYDADSDYVSLYVNPSIGTTLYYSVAYIVNNVNLPSSPKITEGLTVENNVPNKFFPSSSDYTISAKSYKTFNTGGKSAVLFTIAFNPASTARIEGVHVYFNSPQQQTGSNVPSYCGESISHPEDPDITTMSAYFNSDNYEDDSDIPLKRIQSYTAASGGAKEIQLLYSNGTVNLSSTGNFTPLRVMADNGVISDSTSLFWRDFDSANITFVAYRDRRVNTTGAAYNTVNHIESDESDLGFPIWNVPKLQNPSFNGPIDLVGGVINSSVATTLFWTSVYDMNGNPFKYDLTMMKNGTTSIHNETLTAGLKTLDIDKSTNAKYTVTLKLVFAPSTPSAIRETSSADTITFETIHVNVSSMNIRVQVPSDTSVVNLAWNEPAVSGNSITSNGSSVDATFNDNIEQHYIEYSTTNPTNSLTRLAPSNSNPIERIVSPATKKQYSLPVTTLGALYSFFMHVAASIDYKVDTVLHSLLNGALVTPSASNSVLKTTVPAKVSDVTATTPTSQYVVSGIPIVTLPSQTPVLLTGQTTPTLLLGLNANGLEVEGFISVLVILTQDGTASNPEGEHALLVFPNSGASFDYSNTISQSGGDARLSGGESTTSVPRNITDHTMSTHNNQYTLTIGTIGDDKRYGHSTLQMPSSANSGFVDGDVNYMIILTTRRGVDVKTGMFTYQSLPVVRDVTIDTNNGNYFVNFNISPA